jgi:phosphoribosyl 1,2-cyclic phosphodiesterase
MPRAGRPDRAARALPMRGWTLGSGSSGNALILEMGATRLIVDCGFGPRATAMRLKTLGIAPESIAGLLVTHEHTDHAQGVFKTQHKWRWPVIGSAATLDAIGGIPTKSRRVVAPGTALTFEGVLIESYAIPHDAAAPLAFRLTALASGERAGVAHDLGRVPDALRTDFAGLELLCVEANHDAELLRNGPYPFHLQERIRGGSGHLSNAQTVEWLGDCVGPRTREVVLLHLSEQNNTPDLAERTVRDGLRRCGFRGSVRAAPRRVPAAVAGLNARGAADVQMTLGL